MKRSTIAPDLISTSAAAAILGVSLSTVLRATDRGELRYTRTPGGHHRYWKAAVLEYRARLDEDQKTVS